MLVKMMPLDSIFRCLRLTLGRQYGRDWIRQLYILDVEHRCHASSVVMVNHRLFVFGGHVLDEIDDDPTETPVSYFDLDSGDVSWNVAANFEMGDQVRSLASTDGWIYCFGDTTGRFHSESYEWEEKADFRHMTLLAVSKES
ncbi:hypothetical protein ACLB2K_013842 [Fragaria x ananassa]